MLQIWGTARCRLDQNVRQSQAAHEVGVIYAAAGLGGGSQPALAVCGNYMKEEEEKER